MGAHAIKDSSIQSVSATGVSRPWAPVAATKAIDFIRFSNAQRIFQAGQEDEDSGEQNLCEVRPSAQCYSVKRHQPIHGGMRSGVVVAQPGIFTCHAAGGAAARWRATPLSVSNSAKLPSSSEANSPKTSQWFAARTGGGTTPAILAVRVVGAIAALTPTPTPLHELLNFAGFRQLPRPPLMVAREVPAQLSRGLVSLVRSRFMTTHPATSINITISPGIGGRRYGCRRQSRNDTRSTPADVLSGLGRGPFPPDRSS
ncbi:hypothetical protein JD77_00291 [Micromonospora olivasterospora]|uniref:Uncharacterized protein n=1 Tax=Micromonospora olivasterospora TaxID=1880 RepID=A0A562I3V4_MICOL|nr:hypothetical protein JD77_00291 [Micromonospora olivasterospora]